MELRDVRENLSIYPTCQQRQRNEMAGMFMILYYEGCPVTSNIHSLGIYQPEYPRSSTALPNQFLHNPNRFSKHILNGKGKLLVIFLATPAYLFECHKRHSSTFFLSKLVIVNSFHFLVFTV